MFRFANPEYLNYLFIIPILMVLFIIILILKKRDIKKYGDISIIQQLMPEVSIARPIIKFIFILIALCSLIIAIARPQFGAKLREVKREGIEIIVALDASNSMLAQDIQPNRLERAKMALSKLIDELDEDRFGLIIFGGDAYTQIPLTSDYSAIKLVLPSVGPKIVPKQGTAIGAAIELASKSFDPNSEMQKVIIVITDGENHEDNPLEITKEVAKKGIKVFTLGIGSIEGAPLPMAGAYGQTVFRKDNEGNVVVSKLDEAILKEIAAAGEGDYIRASNANFGLNKLFERISKLDKKQVEVKIYSEYDDQFQYFVAIAILFLLLDILLLEKRNKWLRKFELFKTTIK